MDILDLRELSDDAFVVHFGGSTHEVDAVTFGSALLSFTEAMRALNDDVNPGYSIDIVVEALGPGSFRASLKTIKRSVGNLFSAQTARDLIIGIMASFLWDQMKGDPPSVTFKHDYVIIERGNEKIIATKEVFTATKSQVSEISKAQIAKTIQALNADSSVRSFGIAKNLSDVRPVIEIPREFFPIIEESLFPKRDVRERHVHEKAVLYVQKAVLVRSRRKWEFIWNGQKISAPILDPAFFDRLENGSISLRHGDAFHATIRIYQVRGIAFNVWVNSSYEVIQVNNVDSSEQ